MNQCQHTTADGLRQCRNTYKENNPYCYLHQSEEKTARQKREREARQEEEKVARQKHERETRQAEEKTARQKREREARQAEEKVSRHKVEHKRGQFKFPECHDPIAEAIEHLSKLKYPHNGQHGLDHKRVTEYLHRLEQEDQSMAKFAKSVIDNTTYITYNTLIDDVRACFTKFLISIKDEPYYIIVDAEKVGSEHLLLSRLLDLIRDSNFAGYIDSNCTDIFKGSGSINIAYIDDCIFSGLHATSMIDELCYNVGGSQDDVLARVNYHLIIPYQTSDHALISFGEKFNKYHTYYIKILQSIGELIGSDPDLSERYGCEISSCYPVYSDIKVANEFGSFPRLYLKGILPDGSEYGSLFLKNPSKYIT